MQIIDLAVLPRVPVKPSIKLIIAIGAVLGVFLGVGLAFLLEFLDITVKIKENVERLLGLPTLGQIPDLELADVASSGRPARRRGRGLSG